ncbi:MAG: hypothetical protein ACOH2F_12015 [Cellulomonas sp.]
MRWIPLLMCAAVVLWALRLMRRHLRTPSRSRLRGPDVLPELGRRRRPRRIVRLLHRRRITPPNPFEVLRIQTRLSVVAEEVRALERDETAFARAHHLEATQRAYDALLAEACVLAGVATEPTEPGNETERFREEVELTARGWSW